jgi:hypothetical protein
MNGFEHARIDHTSIDARIVFVDVIDLKVPFVGIGMQQCDTRITIDRSVFHRQYRTIVQFHPDNLERKQQWPLFVSVRSAVSSDENYFEWALSELIGIIIVIDFLYRDVTGQ